VPSATQKHEDDVGTCLPMPNARKKAATAIKKNTAVYCELQAIIKTPPVW